MRLPGGCFALPMLSEERARQSTGEAGVVLCRAQRFAKAASVTDAARVGGRSSVGGAGRLAAGCFGVGEQGP